MSPVIRVRYLSRPETPDEVFENAEVKMLAPGVPVWVVQNAKDDVLGYFPIGQFAILFPMGQSQIKVLN